MQASQGEITVEPRQNKKGEEGALLKVGQGTVAGWLFIKMQQLQAENQSLHGQMFAAGLAVQELRAAVARLRGDKDHGGLLIPQGAEPSGLVVPK